MFDDELVIQCVFHQAHTHIQACLFTRYRDAEALSLSETQTQNTRYMKGTP